MSDTFICEACGGEFEKARPDAEAEAERQAQWPEEVADGSAFSVVCEDCYRAMFPVH